MNIIKIEDYFSPALDVYARLTGAQLKNRLDPENSVFIAESPAVIEVALDSGYEPVSFLSEERLIKGNELRVLKKIEEYINRTGRDVPIYTAEREILKQITGFELTRGALCAMKRKSEPPLDSILKGASKIAVLEGVCDSTNVGALFRSAAALGMDAVLLSPTSADPYSRRSVRVSMGTIFQMAWGYVTHSQKIWENEGISILQSYGFKCAAMALTDNSVDIDDRELNSEEKIALVLGTEGTGLAESTIRACDYTVKIPMYHGVDSLNVGAAGAIAFWQIKKGGKIR